MRTAGKKIAVVFLCLTLLTVFSLPGSFVLAAGTGNQTGQEKDKAQAKKTRKQSKKEAGSEEEVAGKRAENTGVSEGEGEAEDSITAQQGRKSETMDLTKVNVSTYETSDSDVNIDARGAIIFCSDTGETLYGKNAEKAFDPLSITKIMTVLLVMKRVEAGTLSLDDYATCTAEDAKVEEVKMYASKGEKVKIRDLMYAALLESDNDAAAMMGSKIGGNKAGFTALMNQQAEWLGCSNTRFTNANGLIEKGLHASPKDLARIGREAFKYQEIQTICQTRKYKMPGNKLRPHGWVAELTNPFFRAHKNDKTPWKTYNIIGGKTGTWDPSNSSLLEVAEIDGHQIITVVMKTPLESRYRDTRRLLNYARTVFEEREAVEKAMEKAEAKSGRDQSDNEFFRAIDRTGLAKAFFKAVNGLFDSSCVKIQEAYKTKSDEVALSWETRPAADGYLIYRSCDGGEYKKITNTESGKTGKFTDDTVKKNHVYRYFVRAYRGELKLPCV